MIDPTVLQDLKAFNWPVIVGFGSSLHEFNERQWRFLKGLIAELTVEKHSGPDGLVYVGADHKDFDWPKHNLTVELKSQFSGPMYGRRGALAKNFAIKLNNSQGTNKKQQLPPEQVADIIIIVRNDGAFALTKQQVLSNYRHSGDGFEVIVTRDQIIELSGRITINKIYTTDLKERIRHAIRESIPGI
jgi:hypothetical protein